MPGAAAAQRCRGGMRKPPRSAIYCCGFRIDPVAPARDGQPRGLVIGTASGLVGDAGRGPARAGGLPGSLRCSFVPGKMPGIVKAVIQTPGTIESERHQRAPFINAGIRCRRVTRLRCGVLAAPVPWPAGLPRSTTRLELRTAPPSTGRIRIRPRQLRRGGAGIACAENPQDDLPGGQPPEIAIHT